MNFFYKYFEIHGKFELNRHAALCSKSYNIANSKKLNFVTSCFILEITSAMYAENIIIFPILSRRIRNSQVIFIESGRGEAYTWREKSNR